MAERSVAAPALLTRSPVTLDALPPTSACARRKNRGTANFNGGTLKASAGSADFIVTDSLDRRRIDQLNVLVGGAKINSNGFDLTITKALNHGGVGTDGGLLKSGAVRASDLTGAVGYDGNTTVGSRHLTLATPRTPGGFHAATAALRTPASIAIDHHRRTPVAASAAAVPEPGTLPPSAWSAASSGAAWRRK